MPINLDTDEHFLFYNGQHAVGPAGIHDVNGDDLFVCHLIHFHIRARTILLPNMPGNIPYEDQASIMVSILDKKYLI